MSEGSDTRDRVIALERDVKHVSDTLDNALEKLNEMHDVMMQAKGAKWVIFTAAGIVGFVGGVVAWVVPWLYAR